MRLPYNPGTANPGDRFSNRDRGGANLLRGFVFARSRSQESFAAVRIFDFGAAGKSADVDITGFRRVGTRNEPRLVRDWDSVGNVALRFRRRRGCRTNRRLAARRRRCRCRRWRWRRGRRRVLGRLFVLFRLRFFCRRLRRRGFLFLVGVRNRIAERLEKITDRTGAGGACREERDRDKSDEEFR